MPKSTATSNSILALVFNTTAWADIAENDSSAPATSLYIRLHTGALAAGDPGNTAEATYGGYAAVAVVRTTLGWAAPSAGLTDNVAAALFDECTSGSNVITHASINKAASGVGACLYSGALTASRTISAGIRPQFAIGQLDITET
ncbi:MAG: phage tail fiber protein [Bosea sp. (in: a-proteobacteria)]